MKQKYLKVLKIRKIADKISRKLNLFDKIVLNNINDNLIDLYPIETINFTKKSIPSKYYYLGRYVHQIYNRLKWEEFIKRNIFKDKKYRNLKNIKVYNSKDILKNDKYFIDRKNNKDVQIGICNCIFRARNDCLEQYINKYILSDLCSSCVLSGGGRIST